jgi:L-ascorbate metabolism protein UlaG (beta-lactamase superfamily)
MQIIWHGHSFFQILIPRKETPIKIAIDPYDEQIGLKPPSLEADILLITHSHYDHNNIKAIKAPTSGYRPFLISGPGEYEIKGIFIQGIFSFHDNVQGKERGENTIYTLESEGIKVCHLGDLGQKELTDEQLEKIGQVDILLIPIGGVYTISAKEATKVISQIEPKIVIPMHYQIPKLKVKLDGLDKFLKIMGIKSPEVSKKISISQRNLPTEGMKVIILKPS